MVLKHCFVLFLVEFQVKSTTVGHHVAIFSLSGRVDQEYSCTRNSNELTHCLQYYN